MSDVETVSSVIPDVVPVEEPSVPAPLGELLGEEIMEDCRLMTMALMRVRSIAMFERAHCCDCWRSSVVHSADHRRYEPGC